MSKSRIISWFLSWAKQFLICFALAWTVLLLAACGQGAGTGGRDASPPELLRPVSARIDTAIADRGIVADIEQAAGVTRIHSQGVSLGYTGFRFGEFFVSLGDEVEEGQLLARMDVKQLETQIEAIEENIANMRQRNSLDIEARILALDILQLEYNEMTRAAASASDENMMEAAMWRGLELERNRLYKYQALERHALAMRHAQEDLAGLLNRLLEAELRAPVAGVVTRISGIQPGWWVDPFEGHVHIAYGQEVFVELLGILNQQPGRAGRIYGHIDGRIYELRHTPLTREERLYYVTFMPVSALPVRFSFVDDNPPPIGAFVSIHLYHEWEEDALRIPVNALFGSPDIPGSTLFVYRIENGQSVPVLVEIGARSQSFVAILSGLWEGDEVFVRP